MCGERLRVVGLLSCCRVSAESERGCAAALVTQGLLCQLPIRYLGAINKFSVFWNVCGAVTLIILLPCVAPTHQSAKFVFTTFDSQAYGHYKSNGYPPPLPPLARSGLTAPPRPFSPSENVPAVTGGTFFYPLPPSTMAPTRQCAHLCLQC